MRLSEIIHYTIKSLQHRQMRFWLTILGIVIGIASVVAMLMIGEGFEAAVNRELASFGFNTIYVIPIAESQLSSAGFGGSLPPSAGKLAQKDVDRLRKIPEITDISRGVERRAGVEFKGKQITAVITGVEPGVYEKMTAIEVEDGRFLTDSDGHVAVIGSGIVGDTFDPDKKVRVNSYLVINGVKYRVVGILKKSGSAFGSEVDSGIFVHYRDAQQIFRETLRSDEMDYVAMRIAEGSDMRGVEERVKLEMDSSHKVRPDDRDYTVMTPETIQKSVGQVLGLITAFLTIVASISLLVGALAIATTMFTSVIERTHEIGVLKAVGAKSSDVLKIFIFESCAIGAAGGLAGSLLGSLAVFTGSLFGLPAVVNPLTALFGLLFATLIGLVSGYVPARNAASLDPVDALRYEQ